MRLQSIVGLGSAVAASAVGTGCAGPLNQDLSIADGASVETIQSGLAVNVAGAEGPSVQSLDRSEWGDSAFVVPAHVVEHQPTYRGIGISARTLSRERNEYPTVQTALETGCCCSRRAQQLEGVYVPLKAVGDFILLLPRMVTMLPGRTVSQPLDGYARTSEVWAGDTELGVRPVGEAVRVPAAPQPAVTPSKY